jgi:RNA polymerase sigma factor (sigma-70 family)
MTTPVNDRYEDDRSLSLSAYDQYMRELAWMEPLSEDEERRLLERIERSKRVPHHQHYALLAREARDRLVEGYQPLVLKLARRVQCGFQSMALTDLVNEGTIGLLDAIDRCEERRFFDGGFLALAATCIRQALWSARYGAEGEYRLPTHISSLLSRVYRAEKQFQGEHGYAPSSSQLAARLGITEEVLLEVQYLGKRRRAVSLQACLDRVDGEEDRLDYVGLFQQEEVQEDARQSHVKEALRLAMQDLRPREREVLERRYGLYDGTGTERFRLELAQEMGITAEVVDQYSGRAKRRLYHALEHFFIQAGDPSAETLEDGYSVNEVCALLGLSKSSVKAYARDGRLPVKRVAAPTGRHLPRLSFPKQAVDALAAQRQAVSA